LAKTIRDDLDRPSGRFVRSLALSVGGGALLTFLGAGVAGAQDGGTAGTASDGAGKAQSGDATAVGNRSGTTKTQTASPSGTLGNLEVVDQTAAVANVGVAVANTGGNTAIGNNSNNVTTADQEAVNGLGPATNSGTSANSSNGVATISTGNASAVGNESTTVLAQDSTTNAYGQLGNILIVQQTGLVANAGVALANTGGNNATGNTSDNETGILQEVGALGGIASNSGTARNTSGGLATIATGNASATGNHSETKVLQSSNGSAGGDDGGLALIPQNALVLNGGVGLANSGGNNATGNNSDNDAGDDVIDQVVGDAGTPDGPLGVASNSAEATNWSDGEANIRTGDAQAIGNWSTTETWQGQQAWIPPDGGISIAPQTAAVVNFGIAASNSGGNTANGNTSDNDQIDIDQDIPVSGGVDIGVGSNFAQAENSSDGTASIVTGDAYSTGNRSRTDVEQDASANGGFLNFQTQTALVLNAGGALANSGGNTATGNDSENEADVDQDAALSDDPGIDVGVLGQFAKASNTSDGTAAIQTGTASAVGNDSETGIGQTVDPSGLVINNQLGVVLNVGAAAANSGGNTATGNDSDNAGNQGVDVDQEIEIGTDTGGAFLLAGTVVGANNGEASNTSDGLATISTGAAAATGNESGTNVRQEANGAIDGNGLVLNTQVAPVLNAGVAFANSGGNTAVGNESDNEADVEQDIFIVSDDDDVTLLAGIVTASNDGTASSASDGEANITTGKAAAAGNQSQTVLAQTATGEIDGLGVVVNTQLPFVANVGVGVANSGLNTATGNTSDNESDLDQAVEIGSDNDDVDLAAAFVIGSNSGSAENASDGTADIRTGGAQATGNASATHLTQDAAGHAPGIVLNTQVAGVVNGGLAVANSGVNGAVGNDSDNEAELDQDADVGSNNGGDDVDLVVVGPLTASNSGTAGNASDGTAVIKTGQAQAQGNVSSTFLGQGTDSAVTGLGAAISTQVGGVANLGVGVANSGINGAIGNESDNDAEAEQNAEVGSDNDDDVAFSVIGPLTASNSATVTNSSDGRAKVKTGGALATGNASATNLSQHQDDTVGLGIAVGTQIGGVANVGLGVANSGINGAIGNTSENDIDDADGDPEAFQDADIISDAGDPTETIIFGGATAANSLEATNTSDGEACVCTGDAVASGNVSSTTLIQDLNVNVGAGAVVLTEAGGVLNAGIGLANTGVNGAIGNSSDNTSEFTQTTDINDALLPGGFAGPQTAHNGGTAANNSAGTALVASGNASGTGNQSTTDFVQAAQADGGFAFSTLAGGTTNAGLGLANAGLNFGLGNDSTNTATLEQHADGSGIVSNQGDATNDSDGTAVIGNPEDCEDEAPPTAEPGKPGLPRTGAELEVQAAVGLMLLLLGFGLQRRSRSMA
jgi:hypothetical protein